jgi:hypothetical protein
MAKDPFPKDGINQDYGFDDNQDAGFDDMQSAPDDVAGQVAPAVARKLQIIARVGKAGNEASIPSMPEVKRKVSKVSLEQAARELVNSMKVFAWDDWKDVTSLRDQDAGRKTYEYTGEAF